MTTQPGWYDDGSGQQRYWDGNQWTEHVAGAAPGAGATGPGAPSPSAPGTMPGAGAPKKRRVGMWIGIGIGAFVLLCGGGIAAIVAIAVNATSGPRDTVNAIFDAIEEGDCPAVYSRLHEDMTFGASEAEFCGENELDPTDVSHSVTSTSVTNGDATVRVKATIGEGLSAMEGEWDYFLVKEDGKWLVTRIEPIP